MREQFSRFFGRNDSKLEKALVRGPIIACIGTPDSYDSEERQNLLGLKSTKIDYYASQSDNQNQGHRSPESESYVISAVDKKNKSSERYFNCIGVAAVGNLKGTNENISLLSHQDPRYLLTKYPEGFEEDLQESLKELRDRSAQDSIDVVIFGGTYSAEELSRIVNHEDATLADNYIDVIEMTAKIIKEILGIDARVSIGPNRTPGEAVRVELDTKHRRLYIVRPVQPGFLHNIDFKASELRSQTKDWDAEEVTLPKKKMIDFNF